MSDRVDPLGGWFDLGDRAKLPSLTESRVTQPRTAESAGMKPRAGTLVKVRINAVHLAVPYDGTSAINTTFWTNSAGFYVQNTANPGATRDLVFSAVFQNLPAGATIVSWSMNAFASAAGANGLTSVVYEALDTMSGVSPAAAILSHTNAGVWEIKTQLVPTKIVRSDASYLMSITMTTRAGAAANEVRIGWVELAYLVPA